MAQAAHALCEQLVAGGDPSLMVEEFGGPGVEPFEVGAVIDACTTPPFLVERRVVVVREIGQLNPADAKRLVVPSGPVATTALVLAAGGGTLPQSLSKAVAASGQVVDASVGDGKARAQWLADHLRGGPVRLDGPASALLSDHLGEDMGRLEGLLDTSPRPTDRERPSRPTTSALPGQGRGPGPLGPDRRHRRGPDGQGTRRAPPNARGRRGPSAGGDGNLHGHYRKMLQLDGSGVTSAEEAAQLLGIRSAYPAKKALAETRRLGMARIARAIQLLAQPTWTCGATPGSRGRRSWRCWWLD